MTDGGYNIKSLQTIQKTFGIFQIPTKNGCEVQKVHGWEYAVNSFRVDYKIDTYLCEMDLFSVSIFL